jgi:hypothetical protein
MGHVTYDEFRQNPAKYLDEVSATGVVIHVIRENARVRLRKPAGDHAPSAPPGECPTSAALD